MQREAFAPPRRKLAITTMPMARRLRQNCSGMWATLCNAWLWLTAHPAYQNIFKILSEKWKSSSNVVLGLSRTMCKLRVCAPCRALAGACTNRDPRSVEESWLRRVMHWGPIIAILIVATVTLSSTYTALQMWSLPASTVPYMRGIHFCVMYMWLIPIFWNFFNAMRGPGYVPLGWKPRNAEDEQYLQYCNECRGFKPPRTHHCKQCKRCVMKMDHHCPWINSCVGHSNHTNFLLFLFFVPFGCVHGAVVNSNFLYHLLSYHFTFHRLYLDLNMGWIIFAVTGISFGVGTAIGVLILFLTQVKTIVTNRTQIEDWILVKVQHRRERDRSLDPFVYPYDLGWRRNLGLVVNWRCTPVGNGVDWLIREDCEKYAFTIEQLEQKKLKRERAITCEVKKAFNGSSCPLSDYGLMAALCAPRCLEDPIPVNVGDIVLVTRWERRWVYGSLQKAATEVKGWFPRQSISVPDRRQRSNEKDPPSPPEVEPLSSQTSQSSESDGQEEEAVEVSKADGSGNAAGLGHAKKAKKYKHRSSPNAVKSTSDEEMVVDITGGDSVKHKFPGRRSNDDGQLKKRPKKKGKRTT